MPSVREWPLFRFESTLVRQGGVSYCTHGHAPQSACFRFIEGARCGTARFVPAFPPIPRYSYEICKFSRVPPSAGFHPRFASYACSSILGGPVVCIPHLTLALAFRDHYACETVPTTLRRGPLSDDPLSAWPKSRRMPLLS